MGALLSSWITLLNSAVISVTNLVNPQYFDNDRKLVLLGLGEDTLVTVNVWCVLLLGLRALGFLRGTGIKMATFVLMLQEISWNVSLKNNTQTCMILFSLCTVCTKISTTFLLIDSLGRRISRRSWTYFDTVCSPLSHHAR